MKIQFRGKSKVCSGQSLSAGFRWSERNAKRRSLHWTREFKEKYINFYIILENIFTRFPSCWIQFSLIHIIIDRTGDNT